MKWIKIILSMLFVSMFFFPFAFSIFPSQNTKNLMAVLGLVMMLLTFLYKRELALPWRLLILLGIASTVSIISIFSMVYNQTPDDTYATYVRAAIIWLSAAYVPCFVMRQVHGRIDVPLVLHYLVGVCVFQCVMALLIRFVPAVQTFVDAHFQQGQNLLQDMNRMYGIGASLDVAGSRFAVVLAAMAVYMRTKRKEMSTGALFCYVFAFLLISVVGNMIARTTLVGMALGLGYLALGGLYTLFGRYLERQWRILSMFAIMAAIFIPTGIAFYQTSPEFKDLLRFGFEGFFSLVEKGEWDVSSNNTLETMVVWPEETRTWIIGDGYFANQRNDPNYIGDATEDGYYMGTDIGYLRFIFYFGVIGLLAMSLVILYAAYICVQAYPEYKWLFWMAALVNFVVWFKVATDIFLFFCLFIGAVVVSDTFPDEAEETIE